MPQEKAIDYFHQGYNCAQSVFAAFAEELGLFRGRRPAPAFGLRRRSGPHARHLRRIFRARPHCTGFKHGNLFPDPADKERIFALTRKLADEFRTEFGSLQCRELLHLPPDAEEGARPSERTAAYYAARPCECCVAFCAARAAEILEKD